MPIAIAALAATPALMPKGIRRRGSLDLVGAVTVTAGLAAAVFAIVRAPEEPVERPAEPEPARA